VLHFDQQQLKQEVITCRESTQSIYIQTGNLSGAGTDKEDKAGWSGFLAHLKARGLSSAQLFVSDAYGGLIESLGDHYPEAHWQVRVRDSTGVERLAPLCFVSPGQINYHVPPGTTNGPATVTVTSGATPHCYWRGNHRQRCARIVRGQLERARRGRRQRAARQGQRHAAI
jgi:hypothetical protein